MLGDFQTHYKETSASAKGLKSLMTQRIGNYSLPAWDPKKQAGLEKLREMLEGGLSDGDDAESKLGEMKLSEWENIFDALKLLYNA